MQVYFLTSASPLVVPANPFNENWYAAAPVPVGGANPPTLVESYLTPR